MNMSALCPLALLLLAGSAPAQPGHAVAVSEGPLVMRLNKDEFRIAFGVQGESCAARGCHGQIRYRVHWRTEDGAAHFEAKAVNYAIVPRSGRTIAVDRQYFDTAEGAHTTEVIAVSVEDVTVTEGAAAPAS